MFVPISADTGLDKVHPTWAGTYILDACVFLFPNINFALIDSDCVPVALFEIQELWLSCGGHDPPDEGCRQPEVIPSSPIAPAQKRARSVDTGKATQQQPGPPIKLPKSRSVENFAAIDAQAPPPDPTGNFEDEVDFGGSEPPSPHPTEREEEKSRAATARPLPSRAQDQPTNGQPLKHSNLWPAKASSWLVKPSRRSMLD